MASSIPNKIIRNFLKLILCSLDLSVSNKMVVEICNKEPLINARIQVLNSSVNSNALPNNAPSGDMLAKITNAIQMVLLLNLASLSKLINAKAAGILCNMIAHRK